MPNKTVIPFVKKPSEDYQIPPEALEINIKCNNWKDSYPYSPVVKACLWHNGSHLFINYEVDEDYVAARADHDNGDVYKDSCVEFFISFDEEGYYNLEANCIGKVLLSHRKGRKTDIVYASPAILDGIKRISSLGTTPFESNTPSEPWHLTLAIPTSTFFKHDIKNFRGVTAKCNLYKCGDDLPVPHFLSWQPIATENPDFHRPEFFVPINFA